MTVGPGVLQKLVQSPSGCTQVVIKQWLFLYQLMSLMLMVLIIKDDWLILSWVEFDKCILFISSPLKKVVNFKLSLSFLMEKAYTIVLASICCFIRPRINVQLRFNFNCFLYTACKLPMNMRNFTAERCGQSCCSVKALHSALHSIKCF